jgi:nitrogen fixation protein NifU and related proteins
VRLERIYQEVILDHYKHLQHRGLREPFAAQVYHINPICGDEVTLRAALSDDGERVTDIFYDVQGCSISRARPRCSRAGDRSDCASSAP